MQSSEAQDHVAISQCTRSRIKNAKGLRKAEEHRMRHERCPFIAFAAAFAFVVIIAPLTGKWRTPPRQCRHGSCADDGRGATYREQHRQVAEVLTQRKSEGT